MHLLIDLRFYRPEKYGLAVHIKQLFQELSKLLVASPIFSKITLVFDCANKDKDLSSDIDWWDLVNNEPKFQIHFSDCKYYSIQEQTKFKQELELLKPDLTYFFTFNFPVFYSRPFVYQILDFTIPETRNNLSPKVQAMLWCVRAGINKAGKVIFLGDQTKMLAPKYTHWQFTNKNKPNYKPNQVVYNGPNNKYLTQKTATIQAQKITGIDYSNEQTQLLGELKSKLGLNRPYFTFVSVWRKYKNLSRLVLVFAEFNSKNDYRYQLLICGLPDPKYPEIKKDILKNPEYKEGRIVIAEDLPDEDLIRLHDGSLAHVFPSFSEGFGLPLVEASSRGVPVICSNIFIFQKIMQDSAIFFDPESSFDMVQKLNQFISLSDKEKQELSEKSYQNSLNYSWEKTAKEILQLLEEEIKQV